jgi:hypothetical protein
VAEATLSHPPLRCDPPGRSSGTVISPAGQPAYLPDYSTLALTATRRQLPGSRDLYLDLIDDTLSNRRRRPALAASSRPLSPSPHTRARSDSAATQAFDQRLDAREQITLDDSGATLDLTSLRETALTSYTPYQTGQQRFLCAIPHRPAF